MRRVWISSFFVHTLHFWIPILGLQEQWTARLTSQDIWEFPHMHFKQKNVNLIGEFIYSEFPFIASPSLKSLEISRKTCFDSSDFRPSPLRINRSNLWGKKKTQWVSIYNQNTFSFVCVSLAVSCAIFTWQWKRNHYSNLQVSKFIQDIVFYLIQN